MSLESDIQDLASAVRALTDAVTDVRQTLIGIEATAAVPPAAVAAPKTSKKKEPTATKDELIAALRSLQEAESPQAVKALLAQHGADTVSNMAEEKYSVVIDAAMAACLASDKRAAA